MLSVIGFHDWPLRSTGSRVEHNNRCQTFCLSFVLRAIVLVILVFCGATPRQRMILYLAGVRRFPAWCELPVCQLTILVAGGAGLRTVFRVCFFGKRSFFDDRFLGTNFLAQG